MSKEERQEKRVAKQAEKEEKKTLKVYEKYMEQAIKEAKKAYDINEVPIGCVIVKDDKVIAKRLKRAFEETDDMVSYDYLVVNDDLETCVDDIHSVICAESFKSSRNREYMQNMKSELETIRNNK